MALIKALLEKPPSLTSASKYTTINGFIYLVVGLLLIVWPSVTQTLFRDPNFVGHEEGLMRVIGLTVVVIGWLYVFGGRSQAQQIVAASVIDRLIFVPAILIPVAMAGVFPHLLLTFAALDVSLSIGAWILIART
jgi:Na+-driven multidrug efflux pump